MKARQKQGGKDLPAKPMQRKNVDASMELLFADPRMVEACLLTACGRAAGIDFGSLRQVAGELPSVGPERTRHIDLLWKGRTQGGSPFRPILDIQWQWNRRIVRKVFGHCSLPLMGRFHLARMRGRVRACSSLCRWSCTAARSAGRRASFRRSTASWKSRKPGCRTSSESTSCRST